MCNTFTYQNCNGNRNVCHLTKAVWWQLEQEWTIPIRTLQIQEVWVQSLRCYVWIDIMYHIVNHARFRIVRCKENALAAWNAYIYPSVVQYTVLNLFLVGRPTLIKPTFCKTSPKIISHDKHILKVEPHSPLRTNFHGSFSTHYPSHPWAVTVSISLQIASSEALPFLHVCQHSSIAKLHAAASHQLLNCSSFVYAVRNNKNNNNKTNNTKTKTGKVWEQPYYRGMTYSHRYACGFSNSIARWSYQHNFKSSR